jgi:hypothetical protein
MSAVNCQPSAQVLQFGIHNPAFGTPQWSSSLSLAIPGFSHRDFRTLRKDEIPIVADALLSVFGAK